MPNAAAIAYYPEDQAEGGGRGILAVTTKGGLLRVHARRTLYATGGYNQNLPFPGSDRPGVIAARACGRLAFRWGVRPVPPERRVVILDAAPTAAPLAEALEAAGVATLRVDLGRETVVGTRGGSRLRGIELQSPDGATGPSRHLMAVAALPAPASELPRQHGARVAFDAARGGFVVTVDDDPRDVRVPACSPAATSPATWGPPGPRAAGARAGRGPRGHAARRALLVAAATSCGRAAPAPRAATRGAGPPAPPPGPGPASSRPRSPAGAPATPASRRRRAHAKLRRAILDAAWRTVRDKHYDKTLGGVDWNAVRAKYEPLALARPRRGGLLPRAQPDDRRARSVAHAHHRPRRR